MFNRVHAVGLRFVDFLRFDLAGRIGDVHRPVDEGGDSRPGPAACHRNTDIGVVALIFFRPGKRQVDDGV